MIENAVTLQLQMQLDDITVSDPFLLDMKQDLF